MIASNTKPQTQPEILYEDPESGGSIFPFIQVAKNMEMPKMLYIFAYEETGEFEPGPKGEEIPIVNQIPYQYVNLNILKEKLNIELYDQVRKILGLLPMAEATKLGQEKIDKATQNAEKIKQELLKRKQEEMKNKKEKN